ncbi:MAG: carboxymuconolactone decarboxylase family protein [Actinomycetota bacterium]
MARVPYLTIDDLPEKHHDLLDRDINLAKAMVNSPSGYRAFGRQGGWIRFRSKFDPRLREMAILQVGWVARVAYEWSHHVKLGREFGVSDDDIRAIDDDGTAAAGHPELDQLVLRAAREMTNGVAMTDQTWNALSEHFDDELMTELTMIIAYYNAIVRVLETIQIDVEPDYQPYLDEFPLPA